MAKASENKFPKVQFSEEAAPATPSAGEAVIYVKTDGKIYLKDDAGTETDLTSGGSSPLTTKGDLYGFSTVDARLPVGTNDQVLIADSTETLGVKWGASSAVSWQSYAPAWTASGTNPAIGNGTIAAYYREWNETVDVMIVVTMGSTTTYGSGNWYFDLPVDTSFAAYYAGGIALMSDTGTASRTGTVIVHTSLDIAYILSGTTSVSPSVPHSWANTDILTLNFSYRKA